MGALTVSSSSSGADEFIRYPDSDTTGPKAPQWSLTYCWGPGFTNSALRQAATDAMNSLDSLTSFAAIYSSTCPAGINILWEQMDLPSPYEEGSQSCISLSTINECVKSVVYLDQAALANYTERRSVACHELGHALGLAHSDTATDCMTNVSYPTTYDQHHVAHLQTSHDSPIGHLDAVARGTGFIVVDGWVLDPDAWKTPYGIFQIYVDVTPFTPQAANGTRSDIGIAYPYWGSKHRFLASIGPVGPGPNNVCAYGLNSFEGGASAFLGCIYLP